MKRQDESSINYFLVILLIISQFAFVSSNHFKESFMYVSLLCDMNDRLIRGCARIETCAQGLFPCSLKCNLDDTCVGASTDEEDNCYLHKECTDLNGYCNVSNTNYKHVNKHCSNGGTWLTSENRCQCFNGMVGKRCEEYPGTCSDLISYGYETGIHNVFLDPDGHGMDLIKAKCYIEHSSCYTNMPVLFSQGKIDFNRTWNEYRDGFDVDENNFWTGLESFHRLTKVWKHELVMYLRFSPSGQVVRGYFDFKLSNETSGYRLNFDTSTSYSQLGPQHSFGDCLGNIKNIPFSTWDRDNDGKHNENCASGVGSGWWFYDCHAMCNIFGYYPAVPTSHPYKQQLRIEGVKNETYQRYKNHWTRLGMYLERI